MGNLLSRFKSLESTKETLARIHSEIEEIEDYKWITLRNQNHIIGFYIFGLSIVHAIIVITVYFYYMQRFKNKGLIAFILYVFTFPVLAYFLRNFLKSYYQHKLAVQEDRLHELKRNKRKILNEIMEKETYKVAKELIEKYDPSMLKDKTSPDDQSMNRLNQSMNNSILRQRVTPINPLNQTAMASLSSNQKLLPSTITPLKQPTTQLAIQSGSQIKPNQMMNQSLLANRPTTQFNPALMRPPPPLLPPQRRPNLVRPICAQDRSIVEKVVDYLVGDGPNNRYGLICKFCYSHNGMALKEEFDYLNFRCCFCNNLNLAKKQKPLAPTLISYENAKDNLAADETLNESIKKFKIDDDSSDSTTTTSKQNISTTQIEEIENKLNETKLETESEMKSVIGDDEMQIDGDGDCQMDTTLSSKLNNSQENTFTPIINEDNNSAEEKLNQELNEMKLN